MSKTPGFSLIEILTAILLIGILAAIAIPQYLNQVRRVRQAAARENLAQILRAQQFYRVEHEGFATSLSALDLAPKGRPFFIYRVEVAGKYGALAVAESLSGDQTSMVGAVQVVKDGDPPEFSTILCRSLTPGRHKPSLFVVLGFEANTPEAKGLGCRR